MMNILNMELKPCPFCGETDLKFYTYPDEVFVQCHTCTTTGPNGADIESARIQWNTRCLNNQPEKIKSNIKKRVCLGKDCITIFLTTPDKRLCNKCSR